MCRDTVDRLVKAMTTMATYGNGPSARAREETESRRRGTRRNGETRKRAALRPLCCKSRISTYAIIGCKISSSSVIHRCTLLSVSLSPSSVLSFPFSLSVGYVRFFQRNIFQYLFEANFPFRPNAASHDIYWRWKIYVYVVLSVTNFLAYTKSIFSWEKFDRR